jgi:phosphoenolpyruvate carboxykinase (ATP)
MTFSPDQDSKPNMEALMLPGLWTPAKMPGSGGKTPMIMIRFSDHWFTLGAVSSYQGEWKKSCLTHWIYHVYLQGGTGVHAGTRQFRVQDRDAQWKKVGMVIWGLTGSGKSTHGMYAFDKNNADFFSERNIDVLNIVKDQFVKNDDIVGLFEDKVLGSEKGAWTKTEDVDPSQVAIYKAGMSPRALHENTGKGADGNPDFLDEILYYRGMPNRNARTVMYLNDMAPYFDGSIDIAFPPNMAIFISPGYLADYAWIKIVDPYFAAATLAAGRTVGHPAQSAEGVGEEKYVHLYNPFIIGKKAKPADHVHRFLDIKLSRDKKAQKTGMETMHCYLINTTGRVGSEYTIEDGRPKPVFEIKNGKKKPKGGSGPSIKETELYILQEVRGLVTYEPHPIWGEKVLCPIEIPGVPKERLKELTPFSYRSMDEMHTLLKAQIAQTKKVFDTQVPGLKSEIYHALDF